MTPCRSGRPDNRKGTVTPSARDVTHHGTKPGKKRPTRRRAGPKGSCVTLTEFLLHHFQNTKIVPPAQTIQFRPNYSDRNCQKIRFLKDRNVIRGVTAARARLFDSPQPAEAPLNAVGPSGRIDRSGGQTGRRAAGRRAAGRRAGISPKNRNKHSSGVSNSSVACELPNSQSRCFNSCLIRSWAARSVTTTWAVRAFSVVLMAQTWM